MSTDPQTERCLTSIRELSDALARDLLAISPEAWNGPTNCAPWRVHDLAAHVVGSGEGFVESIRQGLAGSLQPSVSNEARHRRQAELQAATPGTIAQALHAVTAEFSALYDGLQEAQLSTICFHRRGNRSVRWYAAHRLAEVAFHSWDLQLSLQQTPKLEDTVAALVLPTLLESNAPRIYAAGLSRERGSGERFLLAVIDDPPARWLVTIDPDRLRVRRGDAAADLRISGSAAALALLIYGRVELRTAYESGSVRLDGDLTLVDRFPLVFPRP
jgi:uncharacterized protein (TIGR03083 family)